MGPHFQMHRDRVRSLEQIEDELVIERILEHDLAEALRVAYESDTELVLDIGLALDLLEK